MNYVDISFYRPIDLIVFATNGFATQVNLFKNFQC